MELDFINDYSDEFNYLNENFTYLSEIVSKHLSLKGKYFLEVDLVNNEEIHEINKTYRNVDRPTDVISFAFLDNVDGEVKIKKPKIIFLGQIIISIDKAKEQANEYGHSFDRETSFLFVHGLLHLLGYDHMKKEDEEIMFKIQDEILEGTKWKKSN